MKQPVKKGTLRRVLSYIGRYRFLFVLSVLLAAASVVMTLYIPILIGDAIDVMIGKGGVDFSVILMLLQKVFVLIALTAVAQWLMNTINNRITFQVIRDVRNDACAKLQTLPLSYLDSHKSGDIVSRIIADVDQFADGLLLGFSQFFTGVITILGTLIFMLRLQPVITLVVVLITPLSLFVAKFITSRTHHLFLTQSGTRGEQTAFIDEMVGSARIVRAFSHEKIAAEQFDEINERLGDISLKATFFSSLTNPATRFVNSLVYAGIGLFGGLFVMATGAESGGFTVGMLSSFLSYSSQYTKPFNEISGVITELQNAMTCAGRVFELLDEPSECRDREGALAPEKVKGNISLTDVDFSYTPDRPLIQNFNLAVSAGQRVAIVGPTGCGKTTLINLLMRFYDVTDGKIAVDGTDIRDMTRHALRRNYGMVLQETWLASASVRDNICMGKPDATEEEIVAAAKAAHADGFIRRLPNGYDTLIGENGGSLSAGQKQLLCIARVMLCLPPMLILDEATSSIDTRTELRVQEAFARMMQGRTSFIVAHRLSTIREADLILVMKAGNIIEQGTHRALLEKNGFYAALYRSQFEE